MGTAGGRHRDAHRAAGPAAPAGDAVARLRGRLIARRPDQESEPTDRAADRPRRAPTAPPSRRIAGGPGRGRPRIDLPIPPAVLDENWQPATEPGRPGARPIDATVGEPDSKDWLAGPALPPGTDPLTADAGLLLEPESPSLFAELGGESIQLPPDVVQLPPDEAAADAEFVELPGSELVSATTAARPAAAEQAAELGFPGIYDLRDEPDATGAEPISWDAPPIQETVRVIPAGGSTSRETAWGGPSDFLMPPPSAAPPGPGRPGEDADPPADDATGWRPNWRPDWPPRNWHPGWQRPSWRRPDWRRIWARLREQLVDPEEPVDLVEYEETQDATGASAGPATVQTEPVATETELVAMELEPVVTETEFAAAATARTTAEVGTDGEAPPRAVEAEPGWASAGSKFVARPLTSRLVRSATAIAAVFVLILLLLLFNGPAHSKPPAHPTAARKPAPGRLHTRANRTPTSATKQRSTPVIPAPTGPKIPVTVLNNSMVTGLAAAGAHDFAAAGWPVAGIGNLGGRLPQTTLFYGPGELASARALAARFHGITSIQPRPGWLPGSGLTVVLTRYFRP